MEKKSATKKTTISKAKKTNTRPEPEISKIDRTVAYRLKAIRRAADISGIDMANLLNTYKSRISIIESGKHKISMQLLMDYCNICKTSPNEVLGWNTETKTCTLAEFDEETNELIDDKIITQNIIYRIEQYNKLKKRKSNATKDVSWIQNSKYVDKYIDNLISNIAKPILLEDDNPDYFEDNSIMDNTNYDIKTVKIIYNDQNDKLEIRLLTSISTSQVIQKAISYEIAHINAITEEKIYLSTDQNKTVSLPVKKYNELLQLLYNEYC